MFIGPLSESVRRRLSPVTYLQNTVYTDCLSDIPVKNILLQCVTVCYNVLQCVTICYNILQCVTMCYNVLQCVTMCYNMLQCFTMCCNVLQCVTIFLQCVTMFYNVLQCVTISYNVLLVTWYLLIYIDFDTWFLIQWIIGVSQILLIKCVLLSNIVSLWPNKFVFKCQDCLLIAPWYQE